MAVNSLIYIFLTWESGFFIKLTKELWISQKRIVRVLEVNLLADLVWVTGIIVFEKDLALVYKWIIWNRTNYIELLTFLFMQLNIRWFILVECLFLLAVKMSYPNSLFSCKSQWLEFCISFIASLWFFKYSNMKEPQFYSTWPFLVLHFWLCFIELFIHSI